MQTEVDETPIFTELTLEKLEESFDEEITCEHWRGCGNKAEWQATISHCCPPDALTKALCDPHKISMMNMLGLARSLGAQIKCICGTPVTIVRVERL